MIVFAGAQLTQILIHPAEPFDALRLLWRMIVADVSDMVVVAAAVVAPVEVAQMGPFDALRLLWRMMVVPEVAATVTGGIHLPRVYTLYCLSNSNMVLQSTCIDFYLEWWKDISL